MGKTVNIIEPLQSAPAAINKLAAFQRRDAAGRIRQTVVVDERERERERERWMAFDFAFQNPIFDALRRWRVPEKRIIILLAPPRTGEPVVGLGPTKRICLRTSRVTGSAPPF